MKNSLNMVLLTLGVTLLLLRYDRVSGATIRLPSWMRRSDEENEDILRAKDYLLKCVRLMELLEKEKLRAIHHLHSTVDDQERQIYRILVIRLIKRYNIVEKEYLDVLKGQPVPRSVMFYAPGSEEMIVRQLAEEGRLHSDVEPQNNDSNRRGSLLRLFSSRAPHAQFFDKLEGPFSIKNYVRLKHDDTRVITKDLESAYRNHARMTSREAKQLYQDSIFHLNNEVKNARNDQKDVLMGRNIPNFNGYYKRGKEERNMRFQFRLRGLDYDHEHDLAPSHRSDSLHPQSGVTSPITAHSQSSRAPSANTAIEQNLDDIDVALKELKEATVNQKRVRSGRAKEIYNRSIWRIKDRIEHMRRYQDGIRSGETIPTARRKYAPGLEGLLVRTDFTRHRLDWDREHAGRGSSEE